MLLGVDVGGTFTDAVLDACEAAIRRLAQDRRYFAKPTRTLFSAIRPYFSINDQLRVYKVIEAYLALAIEFLESLPPEELDNLGHKSECQAHTRKGTPCQREPLPGRDYCPSHKHLEESFDGPEVPIEEPDRELAELQGVGAAA